MSVLDAPPAPPSHSFTDSFQEKGRGVNSKINANAEISDKKGWGINLPPDTTSSGN
jgi:hypothetical protein